MGFLDHTTNNIIVDAVLTDVGRQKLASSGAGGGLNIIKYSFADSEVDYTLLKKYGETVGKEKIEKNTPIFEANTDATASYSLLYDYVLGATPSISLGNGSQYTVGYVRRQSTEGNALNVDGQDFTVHFYLTGFPSSQSLNMKLYFNSNCVTSTDTSYASGIGSTTQVKYCIKTATTGGNGTVAVSADLNKVVDTSFTGTRQAHIVLEVDGFGTMQNVQVPVLFT